MSNKAIVSFIIVMVGLFISSVSFAQVEIQDSGYVDRVIIVSPDGDTTVATNGRLKVTQEDTTVVQQNNDTDVFQTNVDTDVRMTNQDTDVINTPSLLSEAETFGISVSPGDTEIINPSSSFSELLFTTNGGSVTFSFLDDSPDTFNSFIPNNDRWNEERTSDGSVAFYAPTTNSGDVIISGRVRN